MIKQGRAKLQKLKSASSDSWGKDFPDDQNILDNYDDLLGLHEDTQETKDSLIFKEPVKPQIQNGRKATLVDSMIRGVLDQAQFGEIG